MTAVRRSRPAADAPVRLLSSILPVVTQKGLIKNLSGWSSRKSHKKGHPIN
ncbi:hypothetical protein [Azospirillum argentinense]